MDVQSDTDGQWLDRYYIDIYLDRWIAGQMDRLIGEQDDKWID